MKNIPKVIAAATVGTFLAVAAWGQDSNSNQQNSTTSVTKSKVKKNSVGGVHDMANGVGDAAAGPVKGAGAAAKGVGKGAVDAVTLHPIDAAADVGKGAGTAGKDVAVGTGKGAGKVTRGVGKLIKHIF